VLTLEQQSFVNRVEPIDPKHLEGDHIQPGNPLFGLIWINPHRVSGAPCFYATRVPIKNLFDSIAAGETMEEFLDGFDGVTREQASAVLNLACNGLLADLERI